MANIVVTSSTNIVKVVFNDLASYALMSKGVWNKADIRFELALSETHVSVMVYGKGAWAVSYNGSSNTLQIDSVNGVAPTSNSDLYDKLIALL